MAYLLDTNIAIYLREGAADFVRRVEQLRYKPFLSVLTHAELESGVYARPEEMVRRRAGVDALLKLLPVIDFDFEMSSVYGQILIQSGFSRPRMLDRMIAATAIVADMTLITVNGSEFTDIEGLKLEIWEA